MLCATATAGYICRVNISTAGVMLMTDFNLSQISMGKIFSGFLLGYALFQVPAGMLADRLGAKKVLMIAAWIWVGTTVIQALIGWGPFQTSLSAALVSLVAFRVLLGISESPTYPASAQGVSKWIPAASQGRANGIVIASIGLGSALAPPLVSNIMVHWGWRAALAISALPALIIALLWLLVQAPGEKPGTESKIQDYSPKGAQRTGDRLMKPGFIFLTISYTLQGYVGYIFVTWFYLYLVQERHFDLLRGAWMSSLPWLLSIISIPLGGYVSDRLAAGSTGPVWGRRLVPLTGMALSGILISIGAHTGSPVVAAISLAFATAFILCVEGPFWTMMIQLSGSKSGTAGGIMNMGSNLGGFISPALTPLIASYIGWENALHIAAVFAVLAALLWLGIKPENISKG